MIISYFSVVEEFNLIGYYGLPTSLGLYNNNKNLFLVLKLESVYWIKQGSYASG